MAAPGCKAPTCPACPHTPILLNPHHPTYPRPAHWTHLHPNHAYFRAPPSHIPTPHPPHPHIPTAGSFTITLETKVDPRDAAAWGRFDRALSRLEGRGQQGEEGLGGASAAGGLARGGGTSGGGLMAASSPELGSLSPRASEAGDEGEGGRLGCIYSCGESVTAARWSTCTAAAAVLCRSTLHGPWRHELQLTQGPPAKVAQRAQAAALSSRHHGAVSHTCAKRRCRHADMLGVEEESVESAPPALEGAGAGDPAGRRGQFMSKLRASAGRKLRQLAETTATRISKWVPWVSGGAAPGRWLLQQQLLLLHRLLCWVCPGLEAAKKPLAPSGFCSARPRAGLGSWQHKRLLVSWDSAIGEACGCNYPIFGCWGISACVPPDLGVAPSPTAFITWFSWQHPAKLSLPLGCNQSKCPGSSSTPGS